ncbi:MAG: GntR family transcriptional regulator [Clostridiales bacterium]|nr:GntR family transcriptional regulator [Clostridiales bacterium]
MTQLPFSRDPGKRMILRRSSEDARQYTYRVIKNCILELFLTPGQKMNEIDLASYLNVSRTPVHETFSRLSRENLIDIVPRRGAFVSKIDTGRIEHAIWLHKQLGISMIHTIFINNVKKQDLETLYYSLCQLDDTMCQGNLNQAPRLLNDYYRQLYVLAGDMDLVWDALQKNDLDLQRLLYLATSSSTVIEGFLCELNDLTDALANRDNDKACLIYSNHMSRMLLLVPPLKRHNPDFFAGSPAAAAAIG